MSEVYRVHVYIQGKPATFGPAETLEQAHERAALVRTAGNWTEAVGDVSHPTWFDDDNALMLTIEPA